MYIKQVSVFVENESGNMADVLGVLGKNGIDISALSIADKTDFGILRLIVSDPEKAVSILKEEGMIVKLTDVLAVGIEDKSGSLAKVLDVLKTADVAIEYLYAFIGKSEHGALVIIRADRPEVAIKALTANNIALVDAKEIYRV